MEPFSKRGKAWEPVGLELRRIAEISTGSLLDPWKLAPKVGLLVFDGLEAVHSLCADDQTHLLGDGQGCWSGGVLPKPLPDGRHLCILNPKHSRRRNKVTLMEEIVHAHRGHTPTALILQTDGLEFRDYIQEQEEEAYGIGSAALLPWSQFFVAVNASKSFEEIAEQFDVSPDLVGYRVKITGAYRLYQARQRRRRAGTMG